LVAECSQGVCRQKQPAFRRQRFRLQGPNSFPPRLCIDSRIRFTRNFTFPDQDSRPHAAISSTTLFARKFPVTTTQIWHALAGGALIGVGSATLLLLNGRVAGVSGILGNVIRATAGEQAWRIAFLIGLIVPALVFGAGSPLLPADWRWAIASGLLVGIGTQLGSGCTSGHGVCGLANLSTRSLVATLMFMGAAVTTVFLVRHVMAQ